MGEKEKRKREAIFEQITKKDKREREREREYTEKP